MSKTIFENGLLNIVPIPKEFEDYEKMISDKVESLPQDRKNQSGLNTLF